MAERFVLLSYDPVGNSLGAYRFGGMKGYGVKDFDDLENAKRFLR